MIFRLTLKLAKKIGIAHLPVISCEEGRNRLIDWSANLFKVQHTQFIILTNTVSLYSMVMHGQGITNDKQFVRDVFRHMKEFMTIDGNKVIFESFIEPRDKNVAFSKIVDRRVLGSMNDLVFQAKVLLSEGQKLPFDISFLLNESPMSYLNYNCPKDEFQKLHILDAGSPVNGNRGNNVIYINAVRPPPVKL